MSDLPSVTRRDMITLPAKLFLVNTLGGFFTPNPNCPSPQVIRETIQVPSPDAENRLCSAGLGDFVGIYHLSHQLVSTYGTTIFPEISGILHDVATGGLEKAGFRDSLQLQVDEFKQGWETRKSSATQEARERISSPRFKINTSNTKDKREDVEIFLQKFADICPVLVLALPDTVEIISGGGTAGGNLVQLTSPTQIEAATVTFLHEGIHAMEQNWRRIKPYLSRSQFINYLEGYFTVIKQTTEQIFSNQLEEAQKIKNGNPWLFAHKYEDGGPGEEKIEQYEKAFLPATLEKSFSDKPEGLRASYRFTQVGHFVGSRLMEIQKKVDRNEALSVEENTILNHPLARELMYYVLDESKHYFVGPIQKDAGIMVKSSDIPQEGFLSDLNALMQRKRIALIAPSVPITSTYSEIRNKFGLADTEPSDEFKQLTEYGAKLVGEYIGPKEQKRYRIFSLPYDTKLPDRMTFYLYTESGIGAARRILISIPRSKFDPTLTERNFSWQEKDNGSQVSMRLNQDTNLTLVFNEHRDIADDQPDLGFDVPINIVQRPYRIIFNDFTNSFRTHLARTDLAMIRDLTKNDSHLKSGQVVSMYDQKGTLKYFPINISDADTVQTVLIFPGQDLSGYRGNRINRRDVVIYSKVNSPPDLSTEGTLDEYQRMGIRLYSRDAITSTYYANDPTDINNVYEMEFDSSIKGYIDSILQQPDEYLVSIQPFTVNAANRYDPSFRTLQYVVSISNKSTGITQLILPKHIGWAA